MQIGDAIYNLIKDNAYSAYPLRAPESAELPYVVYFVTSTIPAQVKEAKSTFFKYNFQVSVFHTSLRAAQTIADTIRNKIDAYSGTSMTITIDKIEFENEYHLYEDEINVYHIIQDYSLTTKT